MNGGRARGEASRPLSRRPGAPFRPEQLLAMQEIEIGPGSSPSHAVQAEIVFLRTLLEENQEWLVDRTIAYAKRHQFTKETSTLREAWRKSIEGLSNSVVRILEIPEIGIDPAQDPENDPAAQFVVPISRKHRAWGVSLRQFMALFKHYRRSYLDLLMEHATVHRRTALREKLDLAFDRIEIAMASAWEAVPSAEADQELRAANRFQTREKNKYLTIFESLREPVFFIDAEGNIENLNAAASRTFGRTSSPGGTYYSRRLDLLWPKAADIPELLASASEGVLERNLPTTNGDCWFEVKASAMLDVSGKFTGTIVTCSDTTERRRAACTLDESERRYRGLFEFMTSGLALHEMVFDEAGRPCDYRFLEVNRAFETLTGLRAADIIGRTVREVLPETETFWINTYGEVVLSGRPVQFENYSRQLDRHFEVVAYSPQPGQFATICRDISERKIAEERLRESESRMRAVLAASPLAIITLSLDGRIESWNAAAVAMFGWVAVDAVGEPITALFPRMGMDFALMKKLMLRNNDRLSGSVREARRRDGAPIWVSISAAPILDESGEPSGFVAEIEDVSVRKRTEEALKESEAMFRQIAESLGEAIWLRNRAGMLYISPGFERIWGRPRDDVYRDPQAFIETIVPEDRGRIQRCLESPALTTQGRFDEEYRIQRPDGSIRWVWARTFPIQESGSALRVGIAEDVTDRKTYEAQLIEAKVHAEAAKRSQSEFLANMSHELRTPLNSILGFSEVMAGEMLGPIGIGRYREYAKDIHSSGKLLLDIINDILDLARVEVGGVQLKRQACDAGELLQAVARILELRAKEKGLSFEVGRRRAIPPLDADPLRLKQVLLNLGSNAIKFTPRGGKVSLQACWDEKSGHEFIVADTGIGMSPAEIEVARKPFGQVAAAQRRGHQGTGLGLPIAESLVRLHGGQLDMESTPGLGTTIRFSIPHREV